MKWSTRQRSERWRKLPPYLLVMFSLASALTAGGAGARVLSRIAAAPSNPFDAFADVFPGQPRSAVTAHGFSCSTTLADDGEHVDEHCVLRPESGTFSRVEALISGDVIRRLDFEISENRLRLGDLTILWGVPELQRYNRAVHVVWRHLGISTLVTRRTKGFSLYLPVHRVFFFTPRLSFVAC